MRDPHDFHHIGFDLDLLGVHLSKAEFAEIARVPSFGLFRDGGEAEFHGIKIGLTVTGA